MATNQPLLKAALNQLYDSLFDHNDDDLKKENSATQAFLLLSEYYRHSGNPYFLQKIKEVWASVKNSENKWRDDLWQPALANFAYEMKMLDKDGAAKVLKKVMSTWTTKNSGYPKDVNITNITALKDALLAFKVHINHVSAYEFILRGCPLISNVLGPNIVPEKIFEILNQVISTLPSHMPPSAISDPLYEANNFFALAYLKLCQTKLEVDFNFLSGELRKLEYSEPDQDRIMRHITSHHDYADIMQELGSMSLDWQSMRRTQMGIVRKFNNICRERFYADYPTTMLFEDIDDQLDMHGVELQAFPEIGRMLGFEVQVKQPGSFDGDEDGDYDDYDEEGDEEEEHGEDEFAVNPEDAIEDAGYEASSELENERLEDGYDGGSDNDEVMSGTEIHGESNEAEEENNADVSEDDITEYDGKGQKEAANHDEE